MRRFSRSRLGIALLVVLAAGVGVAVAVLVHGGDESSPPQSVASPPPRKAGQRSFLSLVIPPPAGGLPGTDVPNRIARRARSLPLAQKVAQMMVVGFSGTSQSSAVSAVRGMDVGGMVLDRSNFQTPTQLAGLVRAVRVGARHAAGAPPPHPHHDPPLLTAAQLGGEFRAFPALPPPDAPADLASVEQGASETRDAARALERAGLNGVLAPGLDV